MRLDKNILTRLTKAIAFRIWLGGGAASTILTFAFLPHWLIPWVMLIVVLIGTYLLSSHYDAEVIDLRRQIRTLEEDPFQDEQIRMVRTRTNALSPAARGLLQVLLQHGPLERGRFQLESQLAEQDFLYVLDQISNTGFVERYLEGVAQMWQIRQQYVHYLRRVLYGLNRVE